MNPRTGGIAEGLRAWARGLYALEAAAELLIRYDHPFGAPLLAGPWVEYDADLDRYWFNTETVVEQGGCLSSGERRVLDVAASLADPDHEVSLVEVLSGLDREAVALVLAAVAHAAGTHEHSRLLPDPDGRWQASDGTRLASHRLSSLYDWPSDEADAAVLTPRSQDEETRDV
jgi:hypothetical protein